MYYWLNNGNKLEKLNKIMMKYSPSEARMITGDIRCDDVTGLDKFPIVLQCDGDTALKLTD
jgi:hypothetical protein